LVRYYPQTNSKTEEASRGTVLYCYSGMKLLVQLLVLARIITNDGLFTEQRRFPPRKEPPEIRKVNRKKGKKHFRYLPDN
jgi:hypothetical protein